MDEATRSAARFIVVCTIAIFAAEYMTRSERATVRWMILAVVWVIIVCMLMWTVQMG